MDESGVSSSGWRLVGTVAAIYSAWIITCILSVGMLSTWHTALVRVYVGLRFNKWGLAFYNDMVVLFLVMGWLALVIGIESWYRRSANERVLARRFGRTLAIMVCASIVGYVLGRAV